MGPYDCPVLGRPELDVVFTISLSPWVVVVGNGLGDISMVF